MVRVHVLLPRALGSVLGDFGDFLGVFVPIVLGQIIVLHRQPGIEKSRRLLQREREVGHNRVASLIELDFRHFLLPDAFEFVHQFVHRPVRDAVPHFRVGVPRSGVGVRIKPAVSPVGVGLFFPQVQEESGARPASQHAVHHRERDVVGIGPPHGVIARNNIGLNGTRPVNQEDLRRGGWRKLAQVRRAHRAAFPVAQVLFDQGHDFVISHVAGHAEDRVAGDVVLTVKFFEVVGRHAFDRVGRSRHHGGRETPVERPVELFPSQELRRGPFLLDFRKLAGLVFLELVARERRTQHHIAQEVQQLVRVFHQSRDSDRGIARSKIRRGT